MPEQRKHNAPDYAQFDAMPTAALEEILRMDADLADGSENDMDAILYIMGVLAARRKQQTPLDAPDAQAAWAAFTQRYAPGEGDGTPLLTWEAPTASNPAAPEQPVRQKKKRKAFRTLALIAAAVLLLLGITATAYALGYDLWGAIGRWTEETFRFTTGQDAGHTVPSGTVLYDSLQQALEAYDMEDACVPAQVPDGYVLDNITADNFPERCSLCALYKNGERSLILQIARVCGTSTSTYEKDGAKVTVYSSGGVDYYIMSNQGRITAAWLYRDYEGLIAGDISMDELKQMLDHS
jgi:hypothetical protein